MADRRQTKSRYTAERNIPGAFDGETVTRRRFMTVTAHGAGIVAASAFLLPVIGFALGPQFELHNVHWQDVGLPDDFTAGHVRPEGHHDRRRHRRGRQVDGLLA